MPTSEAKKLRNKLWVEKNREYVREYLKKWRSTNQEKCKKYQKIYYNKLPLEKKQKKWNSLRKFNESNPNYAKEHYYKNKARYLAKKRRRDAIKISLLHPEHDRVVEQELFLKAQELSETSGVFHEIDHIIPLDCGGYHHHANLQVLPMSLNRQKGHDPFWQMDGYKSFRDVPEFLWPEKLKPSYQNLCRKGE
jgi:5-methylcytosine-specific restriction endonuclease McrA